MKKLTISLVIATNLVFLAPSVGQAAGLEFPARPIIEFVRTIIDRPKPPRPEIPRPDREVIRNEAQLRLERARQDLCEKMALFSVRLPDWCADLLPPAATSDHLLISEVYYDVDSEHGSEAENEWVEIYNGTGADVNLLGWRISDAAASDLLPSVVLPNGKFGVITNSASTGSFWPIPNDAVVIILNSQIGNGLSNSGDALYLKRPDDSIVDALSWGSNIQVFDPAAPDVAEGHSLKRFNLSSDTDTALDWSESDSPTPGE
jgi:hypothetical protein